MLPDDLGLSYRSILETLHERLKRGSTSFRSRFRELYDAASVAPMGAGRNFERQKIRVA